MSRKRLGRIDPARAQSTRAAAEQAALTGASTRAGQGAGKGAGMAPIAQVAAGVGQEIDAEIQRLRAELQQASADASELRTAEAEGRVLRTLSLDEIDLGLITRDRLALNRAGEDWAALKASLEARGQQVPIEVIDQGEGVERRYGLISGMRRVLALRELYEQTGEDRFAQVIALLRPPGMPSTERLIAMIEENEIRSGISFYERGRVAALAAHEGVFRDADEAVEVLFASSHRNRRYKIRCFVTVHEELAEALWYPQAMGERLGIDLAKALRAGHGPSITTALEAAGGRSAEDEVAMLAKLVHTLTAPAKAARLKPVEGAWESDRGERVVARAQPGSSRVIVDFGHNADLDRDTLERLAEWMGQALGMTRS